MRAKRRWRWVMGGAAVLAGLAALQVFALRHREPYLLEHATKISDLGTRQVEACFWLSPHEILLMGPLQNGILVDTVTGRQQSVDTDSQEMRSRISRDLQTAYWELSMILYLYNGGNPARYWHLSRDQRRQVQAVRSHLPAQRIIKGFDVSPDGKRLAFLLEVWRLSPLETFLHRVLPHRSTQPQGVFALYLSDSDGGHMREVAWEPVPEPKSLRITKPLRILHRQPVSWPHDLLFTPDGKHVSFIHKDALWTVPTD